MGAKNLVMLKTHIESINIWFVNDFVIGNILWALAALRFFFFNYVLYSFGLIIRYIFRFQVENKTDRNGFQDSEINGLAEELANFLFREDFHVEDQEREGETECSVFEETNVTNAPEDTESSVLIETDSDILEDTKKREGETECSVSKEKNSNTRQDGKESEGEKEGFNFIDTLSDVHKNVKKLDKNVTDYSVFMETFTDFQEDVKEIDENETECSVFMELDSNVHEDGEKKVGIQEEETKGHVVMDTDSDITTSKCKFLSGKDISCFIEEPTTLTFSFLEFYKDSNVPSVSDNAFSSTENIAIKELSKVLFAQEEKESVQEQRSFNSSPFHFESETEVFGGSDSDFEDYLLYNNNSLPSDSESESSNNSCEGFEYTSVRVRKEGRDEEAKETQFSCDVETQKEGSYHEEEACRDSLDRTEETMHKNKFDEMDSDEEDEDDYEWEEDEVVEQMRLELRNARQGGLATILEEEEEEEKESPKVIENLKPLKIKEKMEYKDHIVEIQKVYKCYAEKMRKLDILNYQTMHAIGLLQLKDPPKLILMSKSTVQGAKPPISQNLWSRKAPKHTSDPILKFVNELHRDLELVYVGQVCLSWEILCWQHKKSQELKQYDTQWPRRYNIVAGEFQLFQVLMQRFIENGPFQGPRIENYAKNRGVVRNLLQVPPIKDDTMKDKKITKWGSDEDAIASERLEEIIMESMRIFWEFIRPDKTSHQIESDVKDPAILGFVMDIRTQLHKKERKLKDILRSGNCIVRRFQKDREDQVLMDHEQLLAQVGLRLISRVVNMKKLRKDQLLWCNEKLNRIKFIGRKVEVEPSFLLFPY